jgi:arabinofuranosyltransferase
VLACGVAGVRGVDSIRGRLGYADGMASAHEPLGRDLARLGFRGRIALSDAGAIPYLSQWWTRDLVGLNDAEIAITGNRDPDRVLATDLNVIVLVSGSRDRYEPVDWNAWERPLYDMAMQRGFACVSIREFEVGYWLWVLARPDSPEGRALAQRSACE